MIFGSAIIALCMLVGYTIGEWLGVLFGIGTNVGGVGFSMVCLLLLTNWMRKRRKLHAGMEKGIQFWKGMYIPVVVAMSASQDVVSAISQGSVAILAGIAAVCTVFILMFFLSKKGLLE